MLNELTIEEAEILYNSTGQTTIFRDGVATFGRKKEERQKPKQFRLEKLEEMVNGLDKTDRLHLLSKIDFLERIESMTLEYKNMSEALNSIYINAKGVQC